MRTPVKSSLVVVLEMLESRGKLVREGERLNKEFENGKISREQYDISMLGLNVARLAIDAILAGGLGG